MSIPRALIWDMGGVLADNIWENLYLDEYGLSSICNELPPNDQRMREGRALWELFVYRDAFEADYWGVFNIKFQQHYDPAVYIELSERFIRPVPGMVELLEELHTKGVPMAICSNNTAFWFCRQMEKLELNRWFSDDRCIVSFREGVAKSDPSLHMFWRAAEALQVSSAKECVFVDDRFGNIQKALETGMTAVQMPVDYALAPSYLRARLTAMKLL